MACEQPYVRVLKAVLLLEGLLWLEVVAHVDDRRDRAIEPVVKGVEGCGKGWRVEGGGWEWMEGGGW